MSYLERLKAKICEKSPGGELTELTKAPSVGFVSTNPSQFLAANEAAPDPATERRRAKALAILAANPALRVAVVAEAGEPAIVGIAIRGKAYGELEIPAASYDGVALLALLEQYGAESPQTMH